ncbi:hypothetical protein B4U80_02472 [Leptotrombidium deliense]|uniref:Chitin-binding type-2 domain-containing protein n=1 Tax=Leptotrombidium deliense TaxID=299467 RepID=A0A443SUV6_9ACAR|nr:hypothetical protein B4U80_02472 [Leptotrombidium deliense]
MVLKNEREILFTINFEIGASAKNDLLYRSKKTQELNNESDDLNTSGTINRGTFSKRKGLSSPKSLNSITQSPKQRVTSRKGTPGQDYPIYHSIPKTSFDCARQPKSGIYVDFETQCQVWHMCQGTRIHSFLCPNGTIFSEKSGVCDWWYNVECQKSSDSISLKLSVEESKPKSSKLRNAIRG